MPCAMKMNLLLVVLLGFPSSNTFTLMRRQGECTSCLDDADLSHYCGTLVGRGVFVVEGYRVSFLIIVMVHSYR